MFKIWLQKVSRWLFGSLVVSATYNDNTNVLRIVYDDKRVATYVLKRNPKAGWYKLPEQKRVGFCGFFSDISEATLKEIALRCCLNEGSNFTTTNTKVENEN